MTEIWKVLIITVLSAVALGCIIGVLTGKHAVKKAREGYKPLLSVKERLIYALCVVVGGVCIVCGLFAVPKQDEAAAGDMGYIEDGMMGEGGAMMGGDGMMMENAENGAVMDEFAQNGDETDPGDVTQNPEGETAEDDGATSSDDESETDAADSAGTENNTADSGTVATPVPRGGGVIVSGGGTGTAVAMEEVIMG